MLRQVSLVLVILCSQAHHVHCFENDSKDLLPVDILHVFEPSVMISAFKKFLDMSSDLSKMFKCLGDELGNCTSSKQSSSSKNNTSLAKSSKKIKQIFYTSNKGFSGTSTISTKSVHKQDSNKTESIEDTNPLLTSHVAGSNTKSPFATPNLMNFVNKCSSKLSPIKYWPHSVSDEPKATESSTSASVTNTLPYKTTPYVSTTLPSSKKTYVTAAPPSGQHSTKYANFHTTSTKTTTYDKITHSHEVPKGSYLPTTMETSTKQSNTPPNHTKFLSSTTPSFSDATPVETIHKNTKEFSVTSTSTSPSVITHSSHSTKLPHSRAYSTNDVVSTVSTESTFSTKAFKNISPVTSFPIRKKESSVGSKSLTSLTDNFAECNTGNYFSKPCPSSPIENASPVKHTTPRVVKISSRLPESSGESKGSVFTSTTHGQASSSGSCETPVTGIENEPQCFPGHFTLPAAPVYDTTCDANDFHSRLPPTWNYFNPFYSNVRYSNPLHFESVSPKIPQLSFSDNIPSEFFGSVDGSSWSDFPFTDYSTILSYFKPLEWSLDFWKPQEPFGVDSTVKTNDFYHYSRLAKGLDTYSSPFFSGKYFGGPKSPWSCRTSEGTSYFHNPVLPQVSTEFPNPFYSHG